MCECDILADILEQLALSSPVSILGFFLLCFISWQPHGISRLLLVARTRLLIQFAFNAFWPISLGLRLAKLASKSAACERFAQDANPICI